MGMDIGGGFGAGGAVDGLQTLIANRMKDRMFAEQQREAMAREQIQRDQLTEQSKYRQEMQRSNDIWRQGQLADKAAGESARYDANTSHLADTIPSGTELAADDPTAQRLQKSGYGALLTQKPSGVPLTGMPGVSDPTVAAQPPASIAKDPGFLFTGTRKQAESDANRGSRDTNAANALGEKTTHDQQTYDATMAKIAATAAGTQHSDASLQRSYQFHSSAIDKVAKPLDDRATRFMNLRETLAQGTPQADALVAPELLTALAGGQGSGVRMNEAEINRIVGGRSGWENLKAQMQHWAVDPTAARSITPEQHKQIVALTEAVAGKLQQKLGMIDTAQQQLADATDPATHKQLYAHLKQQLHAFDMGGGAGGGTTGKPTAEDLMKKYGGGQ